MGAKIDDDTSAGNNCLYVDPGNDPQGLTDGLLGGGRITEGHGTAAETQPVRGAARDHALMIEGKSLQQRHVVVLP